MKNQKKVYCKPQMLNAEKDARQSRGIFGALKGAAYMVARSMSKRGISYREQKYEQLQNPVIANP
mgnify:CR=1 FL=1